MDEFSSRKTASGLSFSRKASSGLVLRDSTENRDRNTQICSRVGCSSRMNSTKGNHIGYSGKAKTTRHPFQLPTSGKEVIGSSSKKPLALSGPRKSSSDPWNKLPCHQVADLETSSLSEEIEASEPVIKSDHSQVRLNTIAQNNMSGGSSSISHSRYGKKTMRRSEPGIDDSSTGSSLTFKPENHGVRDGASASKYNFRNLKCNSINDVVPSSCSLSLSSSSLASSSSSSSELNLDRKRVMGRKRIGEAEGSSSTKGKKINEPMLDDRRNNSSHRGICITNSRRTRNATFTRDNDVTSVGILRSTTRARLNEQEHRSRLQQTESSILTPLLPRPGTPVVPSDSGSEFQFPSQGSSNRMNASARPGGIRANRYCNTSLAPSDAGFGSSSLNRENVGQYSLDGIAEMLLALDRIEQDEELTYEQLVVLQTNLFLSGLGFHDQHRDLRLDIDNMSYEELLALEERMGTVSTALTEEELAKCLEKSIYRPTATEEGTVGKEGDDIKCSICQEEYNEGNEVGRLGCEHQYHVECIQQWLRLKNWCPICKASAAPSLPSAS